MDSGAPDSTCTGGKPLFRDLAADDSEQEITEIESLCLSCGKNGTTKMLLTKIPLYKEVVVMSFCCDHCGWQNNELQPASKIQEKGVSYKLFVDSEKDLSRQIVKTEWASFTIPELEFEIPPCSQEGVVTTLEGVIDRAVLGLSSRLCDLQNGDQEAASKVATFVAQLRGLLSLEKPFTIILDDPSGNSFLENLHVPKADPNMEIRHYIRSPEQDKLLGILNPEAHAVSEETSSTKSEVETSEPLEGEKLRDEVLHFPTNCSKCNAPCTTNMKVTNIPHFKEVVIMATTCEACGHRTNEVKSGGGIEPLGKKITLKMTCMEDLKRDVLKSETCNIAIPELEMEVGGGAMGGRFTTVEGLLMNIRDQLCEENPMITGDSCTPQLKERMNRFLKNIAEVIAGQKMVTIILDDPCGNSYLQNIWAPDPDPHMEVENYTRTFEQNEELGLNDIKTENYEP